MPLCGLTRNQALLLPRTDAHREGGLSAPMRTSSSCRPRRDRPGPWCLDVLPADSGGTGWTLRARAQEERQREDSRGSSTCRSSVRPGFPELPHNLTVTPTSPGLCVPQRKSQRGLVIHHRRRRVAFVRVGRDAGIQDGGAARGAGLCRPGPPSMHLGKAEGCTGGAESALCPDGMSLDLPAPPASPPHGQAGCLGEGSAPSLQGPE